MVFAVATPQQAEGWTRESAQTSLACNREWWDSPYCRILAAAVVLGDATVEDGMTSAIEQGIQGFVAGNLHSQVVADYQTVRYCFEIGRETWAPVAAVFVASVQIWVESGLEGGLVVALAKDGGLTGSLEVQEGMFQV